MERRGEPFVLFPDVVPFTQVDEVCYRFCSEKLETVNNIDLETFLSVSCLLPSHKER